MSSWVGADKKIHQLPDRQENSASARATSHLFYQPFPQAMSSMAQDFEDFEKTQCL